MKNSPDRGRFFKGMKMPKEMRAKMRKSQIKRWLDPKERKRWSKKIKKILADPLVKEHQSKASRDKWSKPGAKERGSRAVKKMLSRPGMLSKRSASLKASWRKYEKEVKRHLISDGWTIIYRGWPDFICLKGKEVRFIEAKSPYGRLSPHQEKVHAILAKFGIKVEIVQPK